MHRRIPILALMLVLAVPAAASPVFTVAEFEALYPAYVNHAQMEGFTPPCVDAAGTIVINADITDITGAATEPFAIVMVCQVPGYPAFSPAGPVTFSVGGMSLLSLSAVPGHPDAFAVEFVAPPGTTTFTMEIQNSGWPEGCLDGILDFAAWDLLSVPTEETGLGPFKARFR
jgi:hypothetical protein